MEQESFYGRYFYRFEIEAARALRATWTFDAPMLAAAVCDRPRAFIGSAGRFVAVPLGC